MKIYAVGIGPGSERHLTPAARQAIIESDVIVGYTPYLEWITDLTQGKQLISTGMKGEIRRCEQAFDQSEQGKQVAVVSSGDAGIYGMAALLLEMAEHRPGVEIVVVPGVTASTSAASLLGSPLANDYAVISLSDLLTPWPKIEKRLEAAALGDFVVCLFNPKSRKRSEHLTKACEILGQHKPPHTWCGYATNALREGEQYTLCTLAELPTMPIDMMTTVIVGNSETRRINNRLVTTRGYRIP